VLYISKTRAIWLLFWHHNNYMKQNYFIVTV